MEKNNNVHNVTVKFTKEEFDNAIDKAFDKKKKDIKMDGFRQGKVPKDVYLKKAGKESLYMDALDILLPTAYDKALSEGKYAPIIEPKVDIKSIGDEGVELEFVITTMPEVKIKKYKGLNVQKDKVKVTQEEINHEIEHLLSKYNEMVVKEFGEVEKSNTAVIDFEGFKDGVAFDGGKGENYPLEIGSNTFIPGFEEQLIGMKKDEEKEINVTFPEDYHVEDLKGKEVTFKVKVNEIKEVVKRELDEEFFEDLGMEGVNSEETLKEEIRKSIEAQKEAEAENNYIDKILEEVSKNVEVDIPEPMVDEEVNRLLKRFEEQMKMQGISLDLYYQFTNSNEEALKSQMEKEAYSNVLYRLMLEEIMNLEKIEVSSEEAEKEAEELAKKYQMEKDEFLAQFGGIEMIQYDLEMRKAIELLKELNK